ncbi:MAG: dephospho-CoA kinase [Vicinamibacteria bacterium]|nr:dephospho-CoA kinase [Vicinamibacteria bacterium]
MLRVGLTGGIACGKSTVMACLRETGWPGVDLDEIAHDLLKCNQKIREKLVHELGDTILDGDGSIDRRRLAGLVFGDPAARRALNALMHPEIRRIEARRQASARREGQSAFITDGALLIESGAHLRMDRLVVVHCDEATQVRRLMARNGLGKGEAQARVRSQLGSQEKASFAHFTIDNSGLLERTLEQARRLREDLAWIAAHKPAVNPIDRACLATLIIAIDPDAGDVSNEKLIRLAARQGGLRLNDLAAAFDPGSNGDWLNMTGASRTRVKLTHWILMPIVWADARRRGDADYLLYCVRSLAQMFARRPAQIADACLLALVLASILSGQEPNGCLQAWRDDAARWAGAKPTLRIDEILAMLRSHPRSEDGMRRLLNMTESESDIVCLLAAAQMPSSNPIHLRKCVAMLAMLEKKAR